MRKLIIFLLAWPAVCSAGEPIAKIRGEKSLVVAKGENLALDAGESVNADELKWEVKPDIATVIGTPSGGVKQSILIITGEFKEPKYTFTVKASGKSADGVIRTSEASVEVTVAGAPGTTPNAVTPAVVTTPIAKIKGDDFVTPGKDLILDGTGSLSDRDKGLIWAVSPQIEFDLITPEGGLKGSILRVKKIPANVYEFTAIAQGTTISDKRPITTAVRHIVTVAETSLTALVPIPEPTRVAPDIASHLFISIVVEPGLENLRNKVDLMGTKIRRSEQLFNFTYYTYDSMSPELTRLNLRPFINGGRDEYGKTWPKIKGPILIIQDANGNMISTEKAPVDEAGVIAKIVAIRLS